MITDFGLASQATTRRPVASLAGQGTPAYVAPEQWFEGSSLRREINTPSAWSYARCLSASGPIPRCAIKLILRL